MIGPHVVSYPHKFEDVEGERPEGSLTCEKLTPFLQKNGQLMGSPLSFPVRCATHCVAYWMALEEYLGRPIALQDLPVLINGDDICFMANDDFHLVWQKWVAKVGCTLSPGNNYISPDYATINSEGYRWVKKIETYC